MRCYSNADIAIRKIGSECVTRLCNVCVLPCKSQQNEGLRQTFLYSRIAGKTGDEHIAVYLSLYSSFVSNEIFFCLLIERMGHSL